MPHPLALPPDRIILDASHFRPQSLQDCELIGDAFQSKKMGSRFHADQWVSHQMLGQLPALPDSEAKLGNQFAAVAAALGLRHEGSDGG